MLVAEEPDFTEMYASAPGLPVEGGASRYGGRSPRYLEDYLDSGTQFTSTETAEAAVSYKPAWVMDSQGMEPLGIVVVQRWNGETLSAEQRPIIQFFDGFRFSQWPQPSSTEAREALSGLSGINGATGIGLVEQVDVSGKQAWLVMAQEPGTSGQGVYVEASQLSWCEGNVFFSVRSYDGVPRDVLLAVAESVSRR